LPCIVIYRRAKRGARDGHNNFAVDATIGTNGGHALNSSKALYIALYESP